jgi:preprotein translocase subunit SecG
MLLHTILNVIYVLIAVSITALILLQRGAGAQAGSGFGAGASATVFGSRGSANFLSSATKWLAVAFFGLSLFMAWNASRNAQGGIQVEDVDAGIMGDAPATKAPPALPSAPAALPAAPTPAPAQPAAAPVIAPATPASGPAATPVPEVEPAAPAAGDDKGG